MFGFKLSQTALEIWEIIKPYIIVWINKMAADANHPLSETDAAKLVPLVQKLPD